jgi:hypothetical protein
MTAPMKIEPELLNYCVSATERKWISATIEHGSMQAAARALGENRNNGRQAVERVRLRAAKMGYAPEADMRHPTTTPFAVKGVSTLYGDDGQPKLQWVKTATDQEALRQVALDFIEACKEEIPREKRNKSKPKAAEPELLNLYVITDYHMGMLAWGEETRGDDWDSDIAERLLVQWFERAIDQSPKAAGAVLCFLGDDLHFDGMEPLTPASKNLLDADTRFARIVRLWIRVRRQIMQMLLDKYPFVHLIEAEGNHNPASSIWMREWLAALYAGEPRVTVDQSPDPYYCYEWGDTSLFFHHGHKRKITNVDDVFVAKFREVFGRTKHSYGHMGHYHHRHELEGNLMVIQQHRTLAASDAWASRGGWVSGREAQVITYHKRHGECGRVILTPEMIGESEREK